MLEADAALAPEEQADAVVRSMIKCKEGLDCMILDEEIAVAESMRNRKMQSGVSVFDEFQRVIREEYAARGRAIPTREALAKLTDMHVFPHVVFLPTLGNLLMYRVRPISTNDPDWCIFDMYSLKTYDKTQEPPKWKTEFCTDALDPAQFRLIPRQDFANIPRQQRGMHSHAIKSTLLSDRQELIIRNMHMELDRYLDN